MIDANSRTSRIGSGQAGAEPRQDIVEIAGMFELLECRACRHPQREIATGHRVEGGARGQPAVGHDLPADERRLGIHRQLGGEELDVEAALDERRRDPARERREEVRAGARGRGRRRRRPSTPSWRGAPRAPTQVPARRERSRARRRAGPLPPRRARGRPRSGPQARRRPPRECPPSQRRPSAELGRSPADRSRRGRSRLQERRGRRARTPSSRAAGSAAPRSPGRRRGHSPTGGGGPRSRPVAARPVRTCAHRRVRISPADRRAS